MSGPPDWIRKTFDAFFSPIKWFDTALANGVAALPPAMQPFGNHTLLILRVIVYSFTFSAFLNWIGGTQEAWIVRTIALILVSIILVKIINGTSLEAKEGENEDKEIKLVLKIFLIILVIIMLIVILSSMSGKFPPW
jgi:hypothetical protein